MKEKFIEIYRENIARPGADKLLAWLETTDFFEAPASTRFHLSRPGGLVEHSVHVYERLLKLYISEKTEPGQPGLYFPMAEELETIAICGLLHDLCKANFYAVGHQQNISADAGAAAGNGRAAGMGRFRETMGNCRYDGQSCCIARIWCYSFVGDWK